MKTAITEMLGIDVPIIAFTHCRDVVAAVSKAGGMGVLGAVAHSPQQLEIDLAWIEAEIGDRPYGIDLIVPAKYAGSEGGGYTLDDIRKLIPAEHIAFVDDILRRYDVPPLAIDDRPRRIGDGETVKFHTHADINAADGRLVDFHGEHVVPRLQKGRGDRDWPLIDGIQNTGGQRAIRDDRGCRGKIVAGHFVAVQIKHRAVINDMVDLKAREGGVRRNVEMGAEIKRRPARVHRQRRANRLGQ